MDSCVSSDDGVEYSGLLELEVRRKIKNPKMDYEEEQRNEIEALESIYPEEMTSKQL